jgi:inner membrane protein
MPSPLAHLTMGYILYRVYRPYLPQQGAEQFGPLPRLLLVTMGFSMLPDLDSVVGILTSDFGRFHNNLTHSLIIGLGVALGVGCLALWKRQSQFGHWFLIALLCYELHIIMDFFTIGRGVMAFWPLSSDRFLSPAAIFYGLHWSEGIYSIRHLWTLFTELAFALPLALTSRFITARK